MSVLFTDEWAQKLLTLAATKHETKKMLTEMEEEIGKNEGKKSGETNSCELL